MTAAASNSNLRQRRPTNNKKKAKSDNNKIKEKTENKDEAKEPESEVAALEDETMWSVIRSHWSFPLYIISLVIGVPYGLFLGFNYVVLQHPEWVHSATGGLIQPRPAVAIGDPRQLLIVGTMSSGTSQVAEDLSKHFRLEIGHETSESTSNFVRDGTASWFHGVRFLPKPDDVEDFVKAAAEICRDFIPSMGFHPRMFRDDSGCSTRENWSSCWRRECLKILQREWGCALPKKSGAWDSEWEELTDGANKGCLSPFQTTLHQVRHPLRTIESMVVKFCKNGVDGSLHESFVPFANALFGTKHGNFTQYSCIEGTSYYLLDYTKGIKNAGGVTQYQVEATSPCQVIKLAGFLDADTLVYPDHLERLQATCQDINFDNKALLPMISTKYTVNQGDLQLTWKDFEGGRHGSTRPQGDSTLVDLMQQLTIELGYELHESVASM